MEADVSLELASRMNGSLELPVMLHSQTHPPVMGIVEALTPTESRVRSLIDFQLGAHLDFELLAHGGVHSKIAGKIAEKRENPPRHYYVIALERHDIVEADALERLIVELRERQSVHRLHAEGGALARASVRIHVDFPVGYAAEDGVIGTGRAVDLSAGGMLMVSEASLAVGATLELTFDLPEHAAAARRELVINSRVVAHQRTQAGAWKYNCAFFHVDPTVRAEIAAFIGR